MTKAMPTHPELVLRRETVRADIRNLEAGLPQFRERAAVCRAIDRFDLGVVPFGNAASELAKVESDLADRRAEAEDLDVAIAVLEYRTARAAMAPVLARSAEIVAELDEIAAEYAPDRQREGHGLPTAYQGFPPSNMSAWVQIAHADLAKHASMSPAEIEGRATPKHVERVKRYRALQTEQGRIGTLSIPMDRTVRDLEARFPTLRLVSE